MRGSSHARQSLEDTETRPSFEKFAARVHLFLTSRRGPRRLIFADRTRSEKNPQASRPNDPFTVDLSTRYLRTKFGAVRDRRPSQRKDG
jgi:hypothetical protein